MKFLKFAQLLISFEPWQVALQTVNEKIAQRDEVVSTTCGSKVLSIEAWENQVTFKIGGLFLFFVVTVGIQVFGCQTKINDTDVLKQFVWRERLGDISNDTVL